MIFIVIRFQPLKAILAGTVVNQTQVFLRDRWKMDSFHSYPKFAFNCFQMLY